MPAARTVVVPPSAPEFAGDLADPWALAWRVWRWPAADVAVGVALAALVLLAIGAVPAAAPGIALALATPVLWRVDVAEQRLPNALVLPCGALAFGAVVVTTVVDGVWPAGVLLSVGVTVVFFLLLSAGGGMGMGDVKLAVVLAVVLALVRVDAVAAAALVAFFSGGVAALIVHLRSRDRSIPFGPFLLAGFWTALALAG